MAFENIIAEAVGGILSGSRYFNEGWLRVVQVAATGWGLAHFVGADIAKLVLHYTSVTLSYGAMLFLVAYFGPTALEKVHSLIKAFQVTQLWKSKK